MMMEPVRTDEFFDICYQVSEFARGRKKGHNWYSIFLSRDEDQLLKRAMKCEEGPVNMVAIFCNDLLKHRHALDDFMDRVVEGICP